MLLTPTIILANRGDNYICISVITKQVLPGGGEMDFLKFPGEKKLFSFKWNEDDELIFSEKNPLSFFDGRKANITSFISKDSFSANFLGGAYHLFENRLFRYGYIGWSKTVVIEANCYRI